MASKKLVNRMDKFIKETLINYLLRLCNSQPLTDSLIAEAGAMDYVWDDCESISDDKRKQAVDGSQEMWQRYECALATAICEHFDEVNGKLSPAIRIPVGGHSGVMVVTPDGFTYEWQENGQTRILPIGRVVMEQTSHDLSMLLNSVFGLLEGEESEEGEVDIRHFRDVGDFSDFRIRELSRKLFRGSYAVRLRVHDDQNLLKVSWFECGYDEVKGIPTSETVVGEPFEKGGIPYGQLLLLPAYLGLDHVFADRLLLKRCDRDVCNRFFEANTRNQKYCSSICKSIEKNVNTRSGSRWQKYRTIVSKLKSNGFVDNDDEPPDLDYIGRYVGETPGALQQFFSKRNSPFFERHGLVIKKLGTNQYSFRSKSED